MHERRTKVHTQNPNLETVQTGLETLSLDSSTLTFTFELVTLHSSLRQRLRLRVLESLLVLSSETFSREVFLLSLSLSLANFYPISSVICSNSTGIRLLRRSESTDTRLFYT